MRALNEKKLQSKVLAEPKRWFYAKVSPAFQPLNKGGIVTESTTVQNSSVNQ